MTEDVLRKKGKLTESFVQGDRRIKQLDQQINARSWKTFEYSEMKYIQADKITSSSWQKRRFILRLSRGEIFYPSVFWFDLTILFILRGNCIKIERFGKMQAKLGNRLPDYRFNSGPIILKTHVFISIIVNRAEWVRFRCWMSFRSVIWSQKISRYFSLRCSINMGITWAKESRERSLILVMMGGTLELDQHSYRPQFIWLLYCIQLVL
jgi:hypothetical protein